MTVVGNPDQLWMEACNNSVVKSVAGFPDVPQNWSGKGFLDKYALWFGPNDIILKKTALDSKEKYIVYLSMHVYMSTVPQKPVYISFWNLSEKDILVYIMYHYI